jgi:O-antigen ligase
MTMMAAGTVFDRARFARWADWLAIAVAVSLPWSTSATSILIGLWLLALLPTLEFASVRRALAHPAGGLPVVFWLLAAAGMLWADVSLSERLSGLRGVHKLLVIPLLFVQFRRSDKGMWVIGGFLASCTALLLLSYTIFAWPQLVFWQKPYEYSWRGVPLKDYLVQSGEFLLCVYGLAHLALDAWQANRRAFALALAALALAFLANVLYVATGRSTLVAMAVLVVVFAIQRLNMRGILAFGVGAVVVVMMAWTSSTYLRSRVTEVASDIANYRAGYSSNSTGFRLEFWRQSVDFIAAAPIVGHGTGTIQELFRRAAAREGGTGYITDNPHNITLEVATQLGLIGVAVLYAMWAAHLRLFMARGLAARIGFGVVIVDIVASLFLGHLFNFNSGWTYVFGVGVLGGSVLGARDTEARDTS